MSVRAYKIKKIEWEEDPSFNVWLDDDIMDMISQEIRNTLDEGGGGFMEISIEKIKEVIEDLKKNGEPERAEPLQRDVKEAEKEGDVYVKYMCF